MLFSSFFSPFGYSNNIKKINISKQVKSTYAQELNTFLKLIEINVDDGNEKYSSINGVLFNKNATKIIKCPCGIVGEYKIPSSVAVILSRLVDTFSSKILYPMQPLSENYSSSVA